MNITRALLDGKRENVIRETYDRRVFRRRCQIGRACLLFFLFRLNIESAENFGLKVFQTLRLELRCGFLPFFFPALSVLALLLIRLALVFLEAHQVGIDRLHEFAEVLFRTNLRLDHDALDVAAHVVECHKV